MKMPLEIDMLYDRHLACEGMEDIDNILNFSSSCFVTFSYHVLSECYLSQLLLLLHPKQNAHTIVATSNE